jgi:ribonucleotide reductase alpha subunit
LSAAASAAAAAAAAAAARPSPPPPSSSSSADRLTADNATATAAAAAAAAFNAAEDARWSDFAATELPHIAAQAARANGAGAAPFSLAPAFVAQYAARAPPFGFNGLGDFVFQTRYARLRADGSGRKERWHETVERVVNGVYNMQRRWVVAHELGWDARRAHASAREMFDRIWSMKFLPPGRGLWAMGTPMTEERFLYAALNNCAFVSTGGIGGEAPAGGAPAAATSAGAETEATRPFTFLMDAAMLGVGVGFDTDGAGRLVVHGPSASPPPAAGAADVHVVADSREGWVASVRALLEAHFFGLAPAPRFDYSLVRPRGSPIRGFGGTASGPDVLRRLHEDLDACLRPLAGRALTVTAIVDIMNLIGRCVVSGDVRQTAEIAFGDAHNPEYIDLKNYAKNPRRAAFGWTSNNSVYAELGMDYSDVARRVRDNGEPGFAWLENMRAFGRMGDAPNHRDARAKGGNPCLEQTLESYELCCLVETFPDNHTSVAEFQRTLRFAFLYAKTVTLGRTHWPQTNRVMLRNRRIGCSISGVAQFVARRGMGALREWCEAGYREVQRSDARLSEWLAIPRSVKTTCVKPSGTVSLLAGATPGMHFPESRFYLRRVRVGKDHEVVAPLRAAGFHVEPAAEDPERKLVVTFPVDALAGRGGGSAADAGAGAGKGAGAGAGAGLAAGAGPGAVGGGTLLTLDDVGMWEQLSLAAFLQRHWADNQVSCTVTFDPQREGPQIARALDVFQYQLKGVSLLPRAPKLQYKQLPYEAVTEAEYRAAAASIRPGGLRFNVADAVAAGATDNSAAPDNFCSSDSCEVRSETPASVSEGFGPPPEEAEDLRSRAGSGDQEAR